MRPYNSDQAWPIIYDAVRTNAVAAQETLRQWLIEGYDFSEAQAKVAAGMLVTGTQDPTPYRSRLLGAWSQVKQSGVIGYGEFRRTAHQYIFEVDFKYSFYFSSTSSYSSPPAYPFGPPAVMRTPTLNEIRWSGVYMVAARPPDNLSLCLCTEDKEAAKVIEFSFPFHAELWLKGEGRFRK